MELASLGSGIVLYISGVEILTLLAAFVLVALAYRGYGKSGSKSLLLAAVGFAMLGAASLTEGILYTLVGLSLDAAHAVRSTLTLAGLVVLLYSLYKTR